MADESVYMTRATQDLIRSALKLHGARKEYLAAATNSPLRSQKEEELDDAVAEVSERVARLMWVGDVEETLGKKPEEKKIPKGG